MPRPMLVLIACLTLTVAAGTMATAQTTLQTSSFVWELSADGRTESFLDKATGLELASGRARAFELETEDGTFTPEQVLLERGLTVTFSEDSGKATFDITPGPRHILLKLRDLETKAPFRRLTLCRLHVPTGGTRSGLLNAWRGEQSAVCVMGLSPSVRPSGGQPAGGTASPGAGADAEFTTDAREGRGAARLIGRNPTDKGAWTFWLNVYSRPKDLTGHVGIGAWVKGDGKGELLKIQLHDSLGHYRDYYITIDFEGWKYCELPKPEGEAIDYTRITHCNLYFNSIPAQTTVECVVDEIRALKELTGKPSTNREDIVLETFEEPGAPYFSEAATALEAACVSAYGTEDAGVAVIACPSGDLGSVIEEVELAAGLPSPHFDGVWSKTSPDVKRSYLFIQGLGVENVEEVIEFAKKGHFSLILIGQGCWCTSLGHFPINTRYYPNGIDDLTAVVQRIQGAGFKVGLHFLAAAISSNDAYVTPVPDDRLVMDVFADLAGDVDEKADFIPTVTAPQAFPPTEEGYMGDSAVLRIGDELITYGSVSLEEPFGFTDCKRGAYGTAISAHRQGDRIAHVKRSYNYFLHDVDKGLTTEVAQRVGEIANTAGVDMLYFDGSERLKGPHWNYNARLHKAYWDALDRPNEMLLQASSVSHYSFHMLSRYASADGVADLKGYLDDRLPRFTWYSDNLLPLDLGWYGIWSTGTTPDQIEYICQKSLGFGCSVSIQTNPRMIQTHPRMDEFIDIISKYEDLRLSGRVPEEMLARLRTPGEEYKLTVDGDDYSFQRVVWGPEVALTPDNPEAEIKLPVDPALGKPRIGFEVRAGRQVAPGPSYDAPGNWLLEDFEDLTPYGARGEGDLAKYTVGTNLAGNTSPGVTQKLESITEGAKLGERCARYTATSTRTDDGGWSAIGKRFAAPPDLREHVGLGVWIHGDNSGAKLKIQPRGTHGKAQDYYTPINFTGWRFFVLVRPEVPYPEPIVYDKVTYLTFYYNGIPAGKTCTVLIDGLKALRTIGEVMTPAPSFTVGEQSLSLDAELGPDGLLLYGGGDSAVAKGPGGLRATVPVQGSLDVPPGAECTVTVSAAGPRKQVRELLARGYVVYE